MTDIKSGGKCPQCGKQSTLKFKPFCSKRCADLDLHKWLVEGYAIPAVELDDVDLDEEE